jgi:hypothetical protein
MIGYGFLLEAEMRLSQRSIALRRREFWVNPGAANPARRASGIFNGRQMKKIERAAIRPMANALLA